METTFLVCLLCLFLLGLALFSSLETAYFSLSSMQIKSFKRSRDAKKRLVAKLLGNPRELLVTMIIVIIIMSLAIQNVISTIFIDKGSWLINVGVPLLINILLGEMIPKSLALPNNTKVSLCFAKMLHCVQTILYPVRKVLSQISSLVVPIFFFFLRKEKDISTDELQHTLKASKEQGIVQSEEVELIRGYLSLQESTVKELMRPREEMILFDVSQPLSKLVHLFVDQECSRIPLCKGGVDHILGIVSSQSFFLHKDEVASSNDLLAVAYKPYFVPETLKASVLLKQMYKKDENLALVVDEYGSTTGIIALEDLVEEVIGEITDRRDAKAAYTKAEKGVIIASGKLELSEFQDIFDVSLDSEHSMVTLGGWLTENLGNIPKPGTKFRAKGFLFHILAADQTRIRRVYIRNLSYGFSKKRKKSYK